MWDAFWFDNEGSCRPSSIIEIGGGNNAIPMIFRLQVPSQNETGGVVKMVILGCPPAAHRA
jgi:hypothetical protein